MSMLFTTGQSLLLAVEIALAALVGYLLLLTAAALRGARRTPPREAAPDRRFLFVVPAHDEERLLPGLLESLKQLDYPAPLYSVYVVADNCADRTAEVARAGGAVVYERQDDQRVGKGYALQWLLRRIWERGEPHDAVVILDADSVVSSNFLRVMDVHLAHGEQTIQAYYAVRDPERSWSVSLRSVALAAIHYLRPLGRMALGGSTGLKGNGMVFAADVLRRHPWPASLTEDIEYHMTLILDGERVTFAPDAVVWAEMPATLATARTQNARWERGRLEMLRRYVPHLMREAWTRRSFLLLDAAVEQLIPPLAILATASVLCLSAAALAHSSLGVALGMALIAGQAIYILAGLKMAQVSRKVYQSLLYAPIFILWKIWLYTRVLIRPKRIEWVRTARNDT
jgi:cellulose synthase/poly-beta-1,6-N-acetylglucosamine synthase-like glycosyltransferase